MSLPKTEGRLRLSHDLSYGLSRDGGKTARSWGDEVWEGRNKQFQRPGPSYCLLPWEREHLDDGDDNAGAVPCSKNPRWRTRRQRRGSSADQMGDGRQMEYLDRYRPRSRQRRVDAQRRHRWVAYSLLAGDNDDGGDEES